MIKLYWAVALSHASVGARMHSSNLPHAETTSSVCMPPQIERWVQSGTDAESKSLGSPQRMKPWGHCVMHRAVAVMFYRIVGRTTILWRLPYYQHVISGWSSLISLPSSKRWKKYPFPLWVFFLLISFLYLSFYMLIVFICYESIFMPFPVYFVFFLICLRISIILAKPLIVWWSG